MIVDTAGVPGSNSPVVPLEIERCTLLSIGGGLGSFTLVDLLRIAGVPASELRVLGPHASPTHEYETALGNSGIGPDDRLRSESCSTPDNPWGFPGFALRESVARRTLRPLARVLGEPLIAEYYTPRRRDLVAAVDREATRIGWRSMHRPGVATRIRRGPHGYVVDARCSSGRRRRIIADHLHLAVGPGPLRIPADSQSIRARSAPGDRRIFHVYEAHDVIRSEATAGPTVVGVRGAGIAANHAIDSLLEFRERSSLDLTVIQFIRTDRAASQPFNVPKSAWSGQLHQRLERADEAEADELLRRFGTTTAPPDRRRERRRHRAIAGGSFRQVVFSDPIVAPVDGRLSVDVGDEQPPVDLDFLIDATGFRLGLDGLPLVREFADACGIDPSVRRIDVGSCFDVPELSGESGRAYVSGALAHGRRYAAPDTFFGLHYAAHHIAADLARRGLGRRCTPLRSVRWWARWMRNARP